MLIHTRYSVDPLDFVDPKTLSFATSKGHVYFSTFSQKRYDHRGHAAWEFENRACLLGLGEIIANTPNDPHELARWKPLRYVSRQFFGKMTIRVKVHFVHRIFSWRHLVRNHDHATS